jgi:hypothetical protein
MAQPLCHFVVLGLGELGSSILDALIAHPIFDTTKIRITTLIRPSTLRKPEGDKAIQIDHYKSLGVHFAGLDIEASSTDEITSLFTTIHANTIIHAGGMTLAPGTQLKLTEAVLATNTVQLYLPWQYGVDYDIIGRTAGGGLFAEQVDVRDALRGQSRVKWVIVSCGIFMSFLFENFWGVITQDAKSGEVVKVTALGGCNHPITATAVVDIGKVVAELLLVDMDVVDRCVYIAGDTLTYESFAHVVEALASGGKKLERELWTTEMLMAESAKDVGNKLLKYRIVFSEDRGLSWPLKETYSEAKGMKMTGFDSYIRSM